MKSLFINPKTQKLRAGWQILAFAIIFLFFNTILMFTTRSILGSLPAKGTLWFLLLGISATIATFIILKYISKRSLSSFGLKAKWALKDLSIGIGIGALIMSCMYVTLLFLGHIRFDGFSWWKDEAHTLGNFTNASIWSALAVFFQFIVVAWWEELAFRGIILQNIAKGLNIKWGIILSTIGFGLIHAGNPNATALSTFLIMVITFKLVYAYLKSGQLWMPIGLHLGWNFFQASIFGFASSGYMSPSLIAQTPISADWISGGKFGAEHSIFIVPFTFASFLLMHLWVKYSRNLTAYRIMDFLVQEKDFEDQKEHNSLNIR
ncbi:CPBP family intramembrane glutamic endopeptidase [Aquimarina brevivitae]|uniref:CAAX prenyl protease 2/Lysostaphin resistance protein A-like domain-containing protein n=1 Tax=Aquimarina brevivitae TaxID=323412 RepID=A0A4Q7P0Q6_9FLAO|nr:type II CAAX endopeptidase family protein [Aquimarina brevivitae]RZS93381.1 hypothetical protein EV197_1959 [Aquimarina brevivitae]